MKLLGETLKSTKKISKTPKLQNSPKSNKEAQRSGKELKENLTQTFEKSNNDCSNTNNKSNF